MYKKYILFSIFILSSCASMTELENFCLNQAYITGDWTEMDNPPANSTSMFSNYYRDEPFPYYNKPHFSGRPDPKDYYQKWYISETEQIMMCSAEKARLRRSNRRHSCYMNAAVFSEDASTAEILAPEFRTICVAAMKN